MNTVQRLKVKIFADDSSAIDLPAFIPVFHRWIQEQTTDELLLDVADYKHVQDGPGLLLMGHEADYAIDFAYGRAGLLYTHKRGWADAEDADALAELSFQKRVESALRSALRASAALAWDETLDAPPSFQWHQVELSFPDRLRTPNRPETYAAMHDDLQATAMRLYGGEANVQRIENDQRAALRVQIQTTQPVDSGTLLDRLVS
ncbi:MAG: hypothetical protein AAF639_01425 [Chloroflexota bacterium]